jgi:hypothetical protein
MDTNARQVLRATPNSRQRWLTADYRMGAFVQAGSQYNSSQEKWNMTARTNR